jgi:hypothetical protein
VERLDQAALPIGQSHYSKARKPKIHGFLASEFSHPIQRLEIKPLHLDTRLAPSESAGLLFTTGLLENAIEPSARLSCP